MPLNAHAMRDTKFISTFPKSSDKPALPVSKCHNPSPILKVASEMNSHAIVIDDEVEMLSLLSDFLGAQGYSVTTFTSASKALPWLENQSDEQFSKFAFIISDISMPDIDGLAFVESFSKMHSEVPVILATAFGTLETAIEAIRKGAFDYITKPFKLKELAVSVARAAEFRSLKQENKTLRQQLQKSWSLDGMIGKSRVMRQTFSVIEKVAPTSAPVFITGESGTGKELVAKAIHALSPRSEKPFIALNCSAIPESLLESELFGHQKGAFTGATSTKIGLLKEADSGTFFLDEIGDLSLSLQAKLLRFLQEKEIRAVGSNSTQKVDVRVLSATHKCLETGISEGWFREDLFYRLKVIPIKLPSLKERQGDIQPLAEHFIRKSAANHGIKITSLSPQALRSLERSEWPGNIRQLENTIERAVVLASGPTITESDLFGLEENNSSHFDLEGEFEKRPSLKEIETLYINHILDLVDGRKEEAAKILGISRRTLYRKDD